MKVIALAADIGYEDKVETLIKSILKNNSNFKIYLINRDFPSEWFQYINSFLEKKGSEIIDSKVEINSNIEKYKTYNHISSATFFRYFIPDLIGDDKVLYLDSDIVVTGDLSAIFDIDLGDYYVAAAIDPIVKAFRGEEKFNAGVMVINNKRWREENMTKKLLDLSDKYIDNVQDSDQGILNMAFEGNVKWMDGDIFNFQAGYGFALAVEGMKNDLISPEVTPLIIHYTTENKPWIGNNKVIFREEFWKYRCMEWSVASKADFLNFLKDNKR